MTISASFPTIRPSLLLDFANTKQLDPRITFSRPTTATFYDGKTTVKAEENLAFYSQEFDNAYWAKADGFITANSTTAPDGTTTADTFTENTLVNSARYVYKTGLSFSGVVTVSCYLKPNGRNWVWLYAYNATTAIAYFNISTGVLGTVSGSGSPSSTITSVGNGWYRCTLTATIPTNGGFGFGITSADNTLPYTGDGTSGVFAWGMQLEQRSSVTAYTLTTTVPITNYIPALQTATIGTARFDHNPTTGESLGLLIEEQRTNLLTYSEQFDNAGWLKSAATVTADVVISPDGTLTADKLIATATTAHHFTYKTATSSGSNTFTVYAKAGEYAWIRLQTTDSGLAFFNLTSGVVGTVSGGTATITSVGNGWYRCSMTSTAYVGVNNYISVVSSNGSTTLTGDGYSGIYIWGAQLEASSFATSYIPTVASQVTRSADSASMTGTNFSSWYRADEGTVYSESLCNGVSSASMIGILINTAADYIDVGRYQNGTLRAIITTNNAAQANLDTSLTIGSSRKLGFTYQVNNIAASGNAGVVQTDTSALIPQGIIQLNIGNYQNNLFLNGTIKKLTYYPKRLTNAELQALTLS